MDSFKTITITFVPIIYEKWVPSRPEGVHGADVFILSKSRHHNPIFASFQNNNRSAETLGVDVQWTDSTSIPNEGPFHMRLKVWNFKQSLVLLRKPRLSYFIGCKTAKLWGDI